MIQNLSAFFLHCFAGVAALGLATSGHEAFAQANLGRFVGEEIDRSQPESTSKNKIYEAVCLGNATGKELQKKMHSDLLPYADARAYLTKEIRAGRGGKCRSVVEAFVRSFEKDPETVKADPGVNSFLLLGLAARIPEAVRIVEKEIMTGVSEEWLTPLKEADETAYLRALRGWVFAAAHQMRVAQGIPTTTAESYGAIALSGDERKREPVRLAGPLLVDQYLRELNNGRLKPEKQDFFAMNALFAGSNANYRQVFSDLMAQSLRPHAVEWIRTFREEPVWVQVRLFPLLSSVGGPEVARELVWLSQNHRDMRVRAIATQTLDSMVEKGTKGEGNR